MAMREFAITGMFGQEMPAFQFDGFANSVDHEGRITRARARGNPNQSLSGSPLAACGGMGSLLFRMFVGGFPLRTALISGRLEETIFLSYGLSFMVFPENGGESGAQDSLSFPAHGGRACPLCRFLRSRSGNGRHVICRARLGADASSFLFALRSE